MERKFGSHKDFRERVANLLDEELVVREGLAYRGPLLIAELSRRAGSLRKAAKNAGLSPTYFSMIAHKKTIITAERYLKLIDK